MYRNIDIYKPDTCYAVLSMHYLVYKCTFIMCITWCI